jgi:hypothetical protein
VSLLSLAGQNVFESTKLCSVSSTSLPAIFRKSCPLQLWIVLTNLSILQLDITEQMKEIAQFFFRPNWDSNHGSTRPQCSVLPTRSRCLPRWTRIFFEQDPFVLFHHLNANVLFAGALGHYTLCIFWLQFGVFTFFCFANCLLSKYEIFSHFLP